MTTTKTETADGALERNAGTTTGAQAPRDPLIARLEGRPLGDRYALGRVLGRGASGVVYEARDLRNMRSVALKCLSTSTPTGDRKTLTEEQVDRFLREAQATAQAKHPNVVEVLDVGRDADAETLYIAYELLRGDSLRALLRSHGALAVPEAARLLGPIMRALITTHARGVVHRDVKPENLVLTDDGSTLKLIDFGIARVLDHDGAPLTRKGASLGTAHYMAPEQAHNPASVDGRVDVWSMGVVWFEALSGRTPYEGTHYAEVLARIATQEPPALRSIAPSINPGLAATIDRALTRDPARRYPSMEAFLTALEAALAPSPATPARTVTRVAVFVTLLLLALLLITVAQRYALEPRRPSGRLGRDAEHIVVVDRQL